MPSDPARSCAVDNVGIVGIRPAHLAQTLFGKYRVYTTAINRPEADVLGVRMTTHLFTTTSELDVPVKVLEILATQGDPCAQMSGWALH